MNSCALVARFGLPGGSGSGRSSRIVSLLDDPSERQGGLTDLLVQARRQGPPRPAPWEWRPTWAPLLMLDSSYVYRAPPFLWRWSACLQGSDVSCAAAAGLSGERSSPSLYWWSNPITGASLVAGLLARGDARAFEAFWRSDLPYPEALEHAYGKPAGTVVRDVATRQWVASPHGPHVTTRVVTAALGWIVLALGVAVVAGRRRQARN